MFDESIVPKRMSASGNQAEYVSGWNRCRDATLGAMAIRRDEMVGQLDLIAHLSEFYGVLTPVELIEAQSQHIARLQAELARRTVSVNTSQPDENANAASLKGEIEN